MFYYSGIRLPCQAICNKITDSRSPAGHSGKRDQQRDGQTVRCIGAAEMPVHPLHQLPGDIQPKTAAGLPAAPAPTVPLCSSSSAAAPAKTVLVICFILYRSLFRHQFINRDLFDFSCAEICTAEAECKDRQIEQQHFRQIDRHGTDHADQQPD